MMSGHWLESLDPEERAQAERLIAQLRDQGADDPEERAQLEVVEGVPQLAPWLLSRHLWTETIDLWRDDLVWLDNLVAESRREPDGQFADAGAALQRLLDAGADPRDIGRLARFIAYESAFSVIHTIDEGYDPEHEGTLPGWALVERDSVGQLTGREIDNLHQTLLSLDPSGREGRPGPEPEPAPR